MLETMVNATHNICLYQYPVVANITPDRISVENLQNREYNFPNAFSNSNIF